MPYGSQGRLDVPEIRQRFNEAAVTFVSFGSFVSFGASFVSFDPVTFCEVFASL